MGWTRFSTLAFARVAFRRLSVPSTLTLADTTYNASGKIVTPGLVDLHIHGYHLVSPLSVPVDHYCLGRGVTTAVDAGSAGCGTFAGFRSFAIDRVKTRLLAFLNISCSGLAFGGLGGDASVPGELDLLKSPVRGCIDCIEQNRDAWWA